MPCKLPFAVERIDFLPFKWNREATCLGLYTEEQGGTMKKLGGNRLQKEEKPFIRNETITIA
jgi:hypothetical protein